MSLNTPESSEEVENNLKVDVAREATDSDPYLSNSWLSSLLTGVGRRIFDFYRDLNRTVEQLFPDTAFLTDKVERWGNIYGKQRQAATKSSGKAVATGTAGSVITIGTLLNANSNEYLVTGEATISDNSVSIVSITRSGTTATATTISDHGLASNVAVTIAGAGEADYNVTDVEITVTSLTEFTYQVSGTPATPATGTITASFTNALVSIDSSLEGKDKNLEANASLTLQSPIAGVDNELRVDYGEVGGGTDQETLDSLQSRTIDRIQEPVAHFNASDIIDQAKEVAGVTRVFVDEAGTEVGTISISSLTRSGQIATATTTTAHNFDDGQKTTVTGADQSEYNVTNASIIVIDNMNFSYVVSGTPVTPATGTISATTSIQLGRVQVYFMRDNDDNPIPSNSEVTVVKDKILEITPANTSDDDVVVNAPNPITVDYIFTSIFPDSSTMRDAITENLKQFYTESTEVGMSVDEDSYRAAIINTIDTSTGQRLNSFTLSAPVGDIAIITGEIAVLGTVTYL